MDCPKCGTWNPEDKTHCWRCTEELPKPKPKPDKRRKIHPVTLLWVAMGIVLVMIILQMCAAFQMMQ